MSAQYADRVRPRIAVENAPCQSDHAPVASTPQSVGKLISAMEEPATRRRHVRSNSSCSHVPRGWIGAPAASVLAKTPRRPRPRGPRWVAGMRLHATAGVREPYWRRHVTARRSEEHTSELQ